MEMQKAKIKNVIIIFIIGIILLIGNSCSFEKSSSENKKTTSKKKKTVNIAYVAWDSEIASSYVIKAVIENKLGYNCELLEVTLTSLWESIAAGDQDGMVAAWLPSLQESQRKKYKDEVINLGPNLEGTRIGLAVPEYVKIYSISEMNKYAKKFDGKIIGIEPDAGIMKKTEKVMSRYDLNDNFKLITGSDATMTTILEKAIKNKKWIAVTGWTPHWKFAKWDLKYLKDPKNIYGDKEHISTVVRKGLKDDMPEVYEFLDNFYWEPEDMEECMLLMQKPNLTNEEAAKRWVKRNKKLVKGWLND